MVVNNLGKIENSSIFDNNLKKPYFSTFFMNIPYLFKLLFNLLKFL